MMSKLDFDFDKFPESDGPLSMASTFLRSLLLDNQSALCLVSFSPWLSCRRLRCLDSSGLAAATDVASCLFGRLASSGASIRQMA